MVQTMAQTPQPHVLSALVSSFGSFDAAHGFAVNLFAVIALAGSARAFLTGAAAAGPRGGDRRRIVLCLADWVLIEDLGFLGGLGTDPNSMIPMILRVHRRLPGAHPGPGPAAGASRRRTGRGLPWPGAAAPRPAVRSGCAIGRPDQCPVGRRRSAPSP